MYALIIAQTIWHFPNIHHISHQSEFRPSANIIQDVKKNKRKGLTSLTTVIKPMTYVSHASVKKIQININIFYANE